MNKQINL